MIHPAKWSAVSLACLCFSFPGTSVAQAEAPDRLIVEDFEDVATWRARPVRGVAIDAWFSGNQFLAASDSEKHHGSYVGELRYRFGGESGGHEISLEKERVSRISAFIAAIEFEVNAKGKDLALSFDIEDSNKRVFRTVEIPLQGDGWKTRRLEFNEKNVPKFSELSFPAIIRKLRLTSKRPDSGSIFLDDITLVGRVSRAHRLGIFPVYEGLHTLPGQPVPLTYRLRNATATEASGDLTADIRDITGGPVRQLTASFRVPAAGETFVRLEPGALPPGSYTAQVNASAGELAATYLDFIGVFTPNGTRVNRSRMWFGVQDYIAWQGDFESKLHREWLKLLGADIVRVGIAGERLEPVRGGSACPPELSKMFRDLDEAGIDAFMLYTDAVPAWTKPEPAWKGPPTDYAAFAEHAAHLGAALAKHPNVKYLEFWNEPDLEFFKGEIEDYLKMARVFRPAFKSTAPDIKIISGGVTVLHPAEKKNFSRDMFHHPELFDVAGFHSHGSAVDYARRQKMVEDWMAEKNGALTLANTEAGSRSAYDSPGALQQAVTLVQKIGYAKSRANSEFYCWFTLQDFWDMDFWADDSMGLVNCDNRPKPSFLAYNELIRRLANTRPLGDIDLHPDLVTYGFVGEQNGTVTYLCWPRPGKSTARLWVSAKGDYTQFDLFGREHPLATAGLPALVSVSRFPLYLQSSLADDRLSIVSPSETFFDVPEYVNSTPSRPTEIPVSIRNRDQAAARFTVHARGEAGELLGRAERLLPSGTEEVLNVPVEVAAGTRFHSQEVALTIASAGDTDRQLTIPVTFRHAYPVRRVTSAGDASTAPVIRLDRQEDVHELAYDPFRPKWRGPEDLSVDARFAHDGKMLFIELDVTDSEHVQSQAPDQLWKQDSVQIGFSTEQGILTEIDLGLSNAGPAIWCGQSSRPGYKGRWDFPVSVQRTGKLTAYRAQVPLERLGLAAGNGASVPFRFALVVNNDNGQGRIRVMEWFGGIAQRKNPDEFGFGLIE